MRAKQYMRDSLVDVNTESYIHDQKSLVGYHATTLDNLSGILEHGIAPRKRTLAESTWAGDHVGEGTYFHTTFPYYELDSSHDETGAFACIIEFRSQLDESLLRPDTDCGHSYDEDGAAIASRAGEAVAYLGPISRDDIVAVHVIDAPGIELIPEDLLVIH